MPGQHAAHGRVVEKFGMTAHRRKHTRALVRSLFVEIPRRAFERAAEVFGRGVLRKPRRALQHLLLQQMQRLFVFADERGGFLRQRRADQIADSEEVAPSRVARFRRDMKDHAFDEVLGAFIPMRVFFVPAAHHKRVRDQARIFDDRRAIGFQDRKRIIGFAQMRDAG